MASVNNEPNTVLQIRKKSPDTAAPPRRMQTFFLFCFTPRKKADRKMPNSIVVKWCV